MTRVLCRYNNSSLVYQGHAMTNDRLTRVILIFSLVKCKKTHFYDTAFCASDTVIGQWKIISNKLIMYIQLCPKLPQINQVQEKRTIKFYTIKGRENLVNFSLLQIFSSPKYFLTFSKHV